MTVSWTLNLSSYQKVTLSILLTKYTIIPQVAIKKTWTSTEHLTTIKVWYKPSKHLTWELLQILLNQALYELLVYLRDLSGAERADSQRPANNPLIQLEHSLELIVPPTISRWTEYIMQSTITSGQSDLCYCSWSCVTFLVCGVSVLYRVSVVRVTYNGKLNAKASLFIVPFLITVCP